VRKLSYLSPTSIGLFRKDKDAFYKRYLADARHPPEPQTPAMALGSAFDFLIKTHIGAAGEDDFEHKDTVMPIAELMLAKYLKTGLPALALELDLAKVDLLASIIGEIMTASGPVPLKGKPDLHFAGAEAHFVLDWKVNGYFSASCSPYKGFLSRDGGVSHKEAVPIRYKGFMINGTHPFDTVRTDLADQLAIYGWLTAGDTPTVYGIDQILGSKMEVCRYRGIITEAYKVRLRSEIALIWEICSSGHFFRDLTAEESALRQKTFDAGDPGADFRAVM
jgi:hypothetical protein